MEEKHNSDSKAEEESEQLNNESKNEYIYKVNYNIKTYKKNVGDCFVDLFCQCFKSVDMIHRREIFINKTKKTSQNYTKFKNVIKNQKYNLITFLPFVLYNQFKFFNNQFYNNFLFIL